VNIKKEQEYSYHSYHSYHSISTKTVAGPTLQNYLN